MNTPDIRIDPQVAKPPFNRANHCRQIASKGGKATVEKYGRGYMRVIGKRGFQSLADSHYNGNVALTIVALRHFTHPDARR